MNLERIQKRKFMLRISVSRQELIVADRHDRSNERLFAFRGFVLAKPLALCYIPPTRRFKGRLRLFWKKKSPDRLEA